MRGRFTHNAFVVTGGLLIWAVDFIFLYAFAALSCERGFSHHFGWVGITANLLAGGATVALILFAGPNREFSGRLASITATLGLIAVIFISIPVVLLPSNC